MADAARVTARSYRAVFALERRVYRIDRLRLNPGGIPVRGVLYAGALMAVVSVLSALPVLGWVLGLLPWPLRVVVLPVGLGALACAARSDGRVLHAAAWSLLTLTVGPRTLWQLRAFRAQVWQPTPFIFIDDGSGPALARIRYRGPGAVQLHVAHERSVRRRPRGRVAVVTGGGDRHAGQVLLMRDGATLQIDGP